MAFFATLCEFLVEILDVCWIFLSVFLEFASFLFSCLPLLAVINVLSYSVVSFSSPLLPYLSLECSLSVSHYNLLLQSRYFLKELYVVWLSVNLGLSILCRWLSFAPASTNLRCGEGGSCLSFFLLFLFLLGGGVHWQYLGEQLVLVLWATKWRSSIFSSHEMRTHCCIVMGIGTMRYLSFKFIYPSICLYSIHTHKFCLFEKKVNLFSIAESCVQNYIPGDTQVYIKWISH